MSGPMGDGTRYLQCSRHGIVILRARRSAGASSSPAVLVRLQLKCTRRGSGGGGGFLATFPTTPVHAGWVARCCDCTMIKGSTGSEAMNTNVHECPSYAATVDCDAVQSFLLFCCIHSRGGGGAFFVKFSKTSLFSFSLVFLLMIWSHVSKTECFRGFALRFSFTSLSRHTQTAPTLCVCVVPSRTTNPRCRKRTHRRVFPRTARATGCATCCSESSRALATSREALPSPAATLFP